MKSNNTIKTLLVARWTCWSAPLGAKVRRSKKDEVVEEEANAGASKCCRASVNEWK